MMLIWTATQAPESKTIKIHNATSMVQQLHASSHTVTVAQSMENISRNALVHGKSKHFSADGVLHFLLIDGHGSRFCSPFLECIINQDHEWIPYGTSLPLIGK
jgi:hypothetical protein